MYMCINGVECVCQHCIGTNMSHLLITPDILSHDYFDTNIYTNVITLWDLLTKQKIYPNLVLSQCSFLDSALIAYGFHSIPGAHNTGRTISLTAAHHMYVRVGCICRRAWGWVGAGKGGHTEGREKAGRQWKGWQREEGGCGNSRIEKEKPAVVLYNQRW